ncbi:MAG: enoyl-CoA hydratase/isomerase family protein, partial [Myxococcota bacterium]|nr:enoyl-CoA hydratase/isomerase family protein [Myxococcota bacterium]
MASAPLESVTVERRAAIAIVRYAHGPRNFLTTRALLELRLCLRTLERDPAVRVIVLTGDRPGAYMLHLEVGELRQLLAQTPRLPRPLLRVLLAVLPLVVGVLRRLPRVADLLLASRRPDRLVRSAVLNMMLLFDAVERSSKITIAAINGPCVGGGFELALCFDYRIASDSAEHRLGLPEVLIGMMPGFGGTQRLLRLVGASRARELLVAGELLTPRAAAQVGLLSRVVAPTDFDDEVLAFAARLA